MAQATLIPVKLMKLAMNPLEEELDGLVGNWQGYHSQFWQSSALEIGSFINVLHRFGGLKIKGLVGHTWKLAGLDQLWQMSAIFHIGFMGLTKNCRNRKCPKKDLGKKQRAASSDPAMVKAVTAAMPQLM